MKVCTKCHIEKDESEFFKDISAPSGLNRECKNCVKERQKRYYERHEAEIKKRNAIRSAIWRKKNPIRAKDIKKKYREKHKERLREYDRERYQLNRAKELLRAKDYRVKNKDKIKEYRINNKDVLKGKWKQYYKQNREKEVLRKMEYRKNNKDVVRGTQKRWEKLNYSVVKERGLKKSRKDISMLRPAYIKQRLKSDGYTKQEIEELPILIDKKRLDIIIKRSNKLIKQSKK